MSDNSKILARGTLNLLNRPRIFDKESGGTSTVRSFSISTDKGEVLLPSVGPNGEDWTKEEAIENYRKTGDHLGIFSDPESSDRYAESLHNEQSKTLETPDGTTESPLVKLKRQLGLETRMMGSPTLLSDQEKRKSDLYRKALGNIIRANR